MYVISLAENLMAGNNTKAIDTKTIYHWVKEFYLLQQTVLTLYPSKYLFDSNSLYFGVEQILWTIIIVAYYA